MRFSTGLGQFASAFLLLALGPLASLRAQAQATSSVASYAVPHFPGGPDSLRTVMGRVLQQASPVLAGQLFLRLELDKTGHPAKAYYLPPPNRPTTALARTKEAQALTRQVVGQLPAWQLAANTLPSSEPAFIVLPLTFGPGLAPLLYSDENPVFPIPAATGPRSAQPLANIKAFLGQQIRYPVEDLRNGNQGTVYAYFEVSETGLVEQRRIAGSISPSLDAEVLRVLQTLPNATAPPRHQGQPMRVAYLLPMDFHIQ